MLASTTFSRASPQIIAPSNAFAIINQAAFTGWSVRQMQKGGWVYILTNRPNGILYIGVTSDLVRRTAEHRAGEVNGFTKRYGLKELVYFEHHEDILTAIAREKAIKAWTRAWKVRLLIAGNPEWNDLYPNIL
jgi:putative endonuclease